jgi:hypothetical protein
MHEPNRKFESCIFCGNGVGGTEHLFGKQIAKGLGLTKHWTAHNASLDPSKFGRLERGPSPGSFMTVRALCDECNGHRFGPIMQRVKPVVLSMARGNRRAVTIQDVKDLRHYIERIALIVDACTSNLDINEERRRTAEHGRSALFRNREPVRSRQDRFEWLSGGDVRLRSAVGYSEDFFGESGDMNVAHAVPWPIGLQSPENWLVQTSKRISIMFRRLVIHIELIGSPECKNWLPPTMIELDGKPFDWPATGCVTLSDYYSMRNHDELSKVFQASPSLAPGATAHRP